MNTNLTPTRTPRTRSLPVATVRTVARERRVAVRTVIAAIESGRLPAYVVHRPERDLYLVRREDAELLWPARPSGELPDPPELEALASA
ncbi:hypothetical protein [Mycobacteroides abscessus]|uniref:hypothetical protein n=1 Tax=Mycobacteroides abscessus TaxID=36809 RepID=UPI00092BD4B5|nr:hypothetical protein [Mycobacteroides abscessus]SHX65030.1 Uncharacterised protein [Mycobacteroides abscessus subsp. abscessus]SHZ17911.1 Uncharacterised protein [Mycobacteroides abscessus subsp. abscessus]SIB51197.1 Uncharacterised protein [Mycobacteroides abscessus subsp. abscessus]SIF18270.1 Uncharacterised protein [Mycobacteroides abscessus subsp. abscessus]SKI48174.1 Uncharacterised protein [Mycobacteroides abscessus subsp. abscessus]